MPVCVATAGCSGIKRVLLRRLGPPWLLGAGQFTPSCVHNSWYARQEHSHHVRSQMLGRLFSSTTPGDAQNSDISPQHPSTSAGESRQPDEKEPKPSRKRRPRLWYWWLLPPAATAAFALVPAWAFLYLLATHLQVDEAALLDYQHAEELLPSPIPATAPAILARTLRLAAMLISLVAHAGAGDASARLVAGLGASGAAGRSLLRSNTAVDIAGLVVAVTADSGLPRSITALSTVIALHASPPSATSAPAQALAAAAAAVDSSGGSRVAHALDLLSPWTWRRIAQAASSLVDPPASATTGPLSAHDDEDAPAATVKLALVRLSGLLRSALASIDKDVAVRNEYGAGVVALPSTDSTVPQPSRDGAVRRVFKAVTAHSSMAAASQLALCGSGHEATGSSATGTNAASSAAASPLVYSPSSPLLLPLQAYGLARISQLLDGSDDDGDALQVLRNATAVLQRAMTRASHSLGYSSAPDGLESIAQRAIDTHLVSMSTYTAVEMARATKLSSQAQRAREAPAPSAAGGTFDLMVLWRAAGRACAAAASFNRQASGQDEPPTDASTDRRLSHVHGLTAAATGCLAAGGLDNANTATALMDSAAACAVHLTHSTPASLEARNTIVQRHLHLLLLHIVSRTPGLDHQLLYGRSSMPSDEFSDEREMPQRLPMQLLAGAVIRLSMVLASKPSPDGLVDIAAVMNHRPCADAAASVNLAHLCCALATSSLLPLAQVESMSSSARGYLHSLRPDAAALASECNALVTDAYAPRHALTDGRRFSVVTDSSISIPGRAASWRWPLWGGRSRGDLATGAGSKAARADGLSGNEEAPVSNGVTAAATGIGSIINGAATAVAATIGSNVAYADGSTGSIDGGGGMAPSSQAPGPARASGSLNSSSRSALPFLLLDDDLGPGLGTGVNIAFDHGSYAGDDTVSEAVVEGVADGVHQSARRPNSIDVLVDTGNIRTRGAAKRMMTQRYGQLLMADGQCVTHVRPPVSAGFGRRISLPFATPPPPSASSPNDNDTDDGAGDAYGMLSYGDGLPVLTGLPVHTSSSSTSQAAAEPGHLLVPSLADLLLAYTRTGRCHSGNCEVPDSGIDAAASAAVQALRQALSGRLSAHKLQLAHQWLVSCMYGVMDVRDNPAAAASRRSQGVSGGGDVQHRDHLLLPAPLRIATAKEYCRWFERNEAAAAGSSEALTASNAAAAQPPSVLSLSAVPPFIRQTATGRVQSLALRGRLPPLASELYTPPAMALQGPLVTVQAAQAACDVDGRGVGTDGSFTAAQPAFTTVAMPLPHSSLHVIKALTYLVSGCAQPSMTSAVDSAGGDVNPSDAADVAAAVTSALLSQGIAAPLSLILRAECAAMDARLADVTTVIDAARAAAVERPYVASTVATNGGGSAIAARVNPCAEADRTYRDHAALVRQSMRLIANLHDSLLVRSGEATAGAGSPAGSALLGALGPLQSALADPAVRATLASCSDAKMRGQVWRAVVNSAALHALQQQPQTIAVPLTALLRFGDMLYPLFQSTAAPAVTTQPSPVDAMDAALHSPAAPPSPSTLSTPSSSSCPTGVDVIFVHGLQGVALKTWRSQGVAATRDLMLLQQRQREAAAASRDSPCSIGCQAPSTATLPFSPSDPAIHVLKKDKLLPLWPALWLGPDVAASLSAPPVSSASTAASPPPAASPHQPSASTAASPPPAASPHQPSVRIIALAYDADVWGPSSIRPHVDIEVTAAQAARQLADAGVGRDGRRTVFVAHSMGGLLVKRLLLHAAASASAPGVGAPSVYYVADDLVSRLAASTSAVIFLGVPHHGAPLATTAIQHLGHLHRWLPASMTSGLHPSRHVIGLTEAEVLGRVNQRFEEMVDARQSASPAPALTAQQPLRVVSLAEGRPTSVPSAAGITAAGLRGRSSLGPVPLDLMMVPAAQANPGYGSFVVVGTADHISICKPESRSDVVYQSVLRHSCVGAARLPTSGNPATDRS